ncbi:DUF6522 family protein [Solirhodobacter olei]|uniref:DUF6522 family protein n=1 Tax=Solirhodobacter olei TaxID=2493082 RepID=UPI000FD73E90|nr:DUF6522 family protein [Solirhodobacter olei]
MARIEFVSGRAQVEAAYLARALALSPEELQRGMREGAITSRLERGEGEDSGRIRLTFFSPHRRSRIVADETGRVLTCVTVPLTATRGNTGPGPKTEGR